MVVAEHFHGTHEPRGLPIAGPVLQDVGLRDVRDVGDVKDRTWKLGTSGTGRQGRESLCKNM